MYTITIVRYVFNTAIFKPQLFSSHSMCLHTRLTEFFLNCCHAFYIAAMQSNECTWKRMSLPWHNLYKCKQVTTSKLLTTKFLLPVYLFNRFFIVHIVIACLLLNPLFYCTLLVLVYIFIPLFLY